MEKEKTISLNRKASHDYFLEDRYAESMPMTVQLSGSARQMGQIETEYLI